jgi:hypothetical protein
MLENGYSPKVGVDAVGNSIVAWSRWDSTYHGIFTNRYVIGTGWGTPILISDNNFLADQPAIAMNSSGNAVVVWEHLLFGQCHPAYPGDACGFSNVGANHFDIGTGWGAPTKLGNTQGEVFDKVFSPQVAMDSSGNAIVVCLVKPL